MPASIQPDLFDAPLLPGLAYRPDMISLDEESTLLAALQALPVEPFRFQGWLGKRETISFGWRYDFDHAAFARTEPIPDFLLPLRGRAAAFAGVVPDDLAQALVTHYAPGAGIGWHRDRPVFEAVVGISLAAPATLRFRRRTEDGFSRRSLHLLPRSAYLLTDEARHGWEHGITPMEESRWSITFRTLSAKGMQIALNSRSGGRTS